MSDILNGPFNEKYQGPQPPAERQPRRTPYLVPDDDEFTIQEKLLNCIGEVDKRPGHLSRQYNHGRMIGIIKEMMAWKNQ